MKKILNSSCFAIAALVIAMTTFASGPAFSQSSAHCDRYARDFASRVTAGGGAGDAFRGGIGGAIGGAVIGGLLGGGRGAGTGALIGGGIGVITGAARGSAEWQAAYEDAYDDCMSEPRGPVHSTPAAFTPEWYDYCAAKYRSFNRDTGNYRTFSGETKRCR